MKRWETILWLCWTAVGIVVYIYFWGEEKTISADVVKKVAGILLAVIPSLFVIFRFIDETRTTLKKLDAQIDNFQQLAPAAEIAEGVRRGLIIRGHRNEERLYRRVAARQLESVLNFR